MPSRKLVISFGLVSIPILLEKAVKSHDIHFNLLCKDSGVRVEYRKVCPGKEKCTSDDLIKGYKYGDDEYVTLTDEELKKLKSKKDEFINIISFVKPESIDPIYFADPYLLSPQKAGMKPYDLLLAAMRETKLWAVAKSVFSSREMLMILRAEKSGIILQTLHYADEVIKESPYQIGAIKKDELLMAKNLIKAMDQPFDIADFKDEYKERLSRAIEAKLNGKKITKTKEKQIESTNSIMDAMQNSINILKKTSKTSARR